MAHTSAKVTVELFGRLFEGVDARYVVDVVARRFRGGDVEVRI